MDNSWYYVQGSERVGPVESSEIERLYGQGTLDEESYIWKKGFQNWERLKDVSDFSHLTSGSAPVAAAPVMQEPVAEISAIPKLESPTINLASLGDNEQVISIKIGYDRGEEETEYGPFSIAQLRRAYEENRINEKTFAYIAGMQTWSLLGDLPIYDRISNGPPAITDDDRRVHVRKPFVAKMLFHDNSQVFEGVCRDVSIGGLQVLVSNFPAKVGETVTLNVHPDNSDYCFTASGKIVRLLDGNQGFSLRFENLNNDAENAISNYIQSN